MMTLWEGLSALGDSRALLPFAAGLALFLSPVHRNQLWRWATAMAVVASLTLASKIAFMGWGLGIESLDFIGISGHAAMSGVTYPVALWLGASGRSRHPWAWALAGAGLSVAIAWSRLPLQAHSMSEITSGLCIGFCASCWVLLGWQATARSTAVRAAAAVVAISAAIATPALLSDLHTHDLVKNVAAGLSGRDRTLERSDLQHERQPSAQQQ